MDQLFSPAFIFWGGGLVVMSSQYGFDKTWQEIQALSIEKQVALIIVGFLVLSLSTALLGQFRYAALRLLEGYWPWPTNFIGKLIIRFRKWNINRLQNRWNDLKNKEEKKILTTDGRREISKLEKQMHYYPINQDDLLPTLLGNAIRAGEDAPYYKYGLDALICWTRLWLLLPLEAQKDLSRSRQSLDDFVNLFVWGMLFLVWAWWWPWVILISAIWLLCAYTFAVQCAMTYSDLIESAFDLYRFELYKAVHWSLPKKSGKDEVRIGKQLTEFLWRGTSEKPINFINPKE
jgi:hypothetical protein